MNIRRPKKLLNVILIICSFFVIMPVFARDTSTCQDLGQQIQAHNDIEDLDALVQDIEQCNDQQRIRLFRQLGMRFYLLGDISKAADFLGRAYSSDYIDEDSLLLAAHAYLLLGNYQDSRMNVERLLERTNNPAMRQQAMAILSLCLLATGSELEAKAILEPYRNMPQQVRIPELFYILIRYELTLSAEDRNDPGEYFSLLQERFPAHPVTSLARTFLRGGSAARGDVTVLPSPEIFLFSQSVIDNHEDIAENGEPTNQEQDTAATTAAVVRGIQIGSFGLRENAEYLANDLETHDFSVVIEEQQRSDRLYYSVLVIPQSNAVEQDIQSLYMRIKAAGYDGFRVYE